MTPGTRRSRIRLRLGMTGVRIPRHVGTWRVEDVIEATGHDGPCSVYVVTHERLESAPRMAVGETGDVICVKLLSVDAWADQLKAAGYDNTEATR